MKKVLIFASLFAGLNHAQGIDLSALSDLESVLANVDGNTSIKSPLNSDDDDFQQNIGRKIEGVRERKIKPSMKKKRMRGKKVLVYYDRTTYCNTIVEIP